MAGPPSEVEQEQRATPVPPSEEEVEAEKVLGSSEAGRSASRFMAALNRAARSFLLYDPANEAIRQFLENVRDTAKAYFTVYGDMDLRVRPFELALNNEVVYLDHDRERSLAFRLYRDGVRRITLQAEVNWPELIKLLEVISVRYTGIRQTEDDMVVLLWKAGFHHIQVEAVEGVVEDDGGEALVQERSAGHYAGAPDDFDLPPPLLSLGATLGWMPVPTAVLEDLRREDATSELPALCIRLAEEVLACCAGPLPSLTLHEATPVIRELRDFLLTEGTLDPLLQVVRCLIATDVQDPHDAKSRDDLAASFLDVRAVLRLLRSVPHNLPGAPPDLVALLGEVPGDHLATLFQAVSAERNDHVRRVARQLIEHYVPTRVDWMIEQIDRVDDFGACQLMRAIARVYPERTLELVTRVASRTAEEIHLDALEILGAAPLTSQLARPIAGYTSHPLEAVRIRAMALVGRKSIRACYSVIADRLKRDPTRINEMEAGAAGEAMMRAEPSRAMEVFREWATPPKFFQFVPPGHKTLLFASVAGLALVPDEEAERMIRGVERTAEKQGQDDVRRACVAAMVRRRRLQRQAEGR